MTSNNAQPATAADDIAAAARYSRYLERLIAANPAVLSAADLDVAFTAADMQSELETGGISDDASLGRALRRLR